ncbi:MAG TPA: hypothetical protein VK986_26025, partial [Tepidisphaeraceae bacterium]|nr:hypothetical protein [Tepidisphaeraceae bacterium]
AFEPGQESPFAGRAEFYELRFGDYLIGMNASRAKTFEVTAPAGVVRAQELTSGKTIDIGGPVRVGPMSTVVLYLGT